MATLGQAFKLTDDPENHSLTRSFKDLGYTICGISAIRSISSTRQRPFQVSACLELANQVPSKPSRLIITHDSDEKGNKNTKALLAYPFERSNMLSRVHKGYYPGPQGFSM